LLGDAHHVDYTLHINIYIHGHIHIHTRTTILFSSILLHYIL
jgi:hypothetical protein